MTREEEIQREADIRWLHGSANNKLFVDSCKWADQNPRKGLWDADKFIKFIHATFTETISGNVISRNNTTVDEIIEDLHKAME